MISIGASRRRVWNPKWRLTALSMGYNSTVNIVQYRMCVVELATARDLLAPGSHPHGFRLPGGAVVWEHAQAGRGKLIRIERGDGQHVRYVANDTLFEVVPENDFHFDH